MTLQDTEQVLTERELKQARAQVLELQLELELERVRVQTLKRLLGSTLKRERIREQKLESAQKWVRELERDGT